MTATGDHGLQALGLVAKRLGYYYLDKDIIAQIAEKTGFTQEFIQQRGEYAPSKSLFSYGLLARNQDGISPGDIKKKRLMECYHFSEKEALNLMKKVDHKRAANYQYYTDKEWGKAANYTLCLNTSQLGDEKTMEIILSCVKY